MSELGHNSGLTPEEAAESMVRALAPYDARRAEFVEKAPKAVVDDMESAAIAVDFVRMARAETGRARSLLDETAKPLNDALQAMRSVAMRFIEDLERAESIVSGKISAYNAERKRRADALAAEQKRKENELRRQSAERSGGGGLSPLVDPNPPPPTPEPEIKGPTIRTNLGGRLTETRKWRPKVVDVTQVPETVLKSPKVIAAIEQVARDLLKNGIEVPGVEKDFYDTHIIS